jgi:hypothetical protein
MNSVEPALERLLSVFARHASARGKKGTRSMTARTLVINVLIFVAVIIVMTALAIWLNLGPVASSAA